MKMFDWVHRKKHNSMEYRRVPDQRKDTYVGDGGSEGLGEKTAEAEKEALLMDLHHVASIQHVLDGILTIGTLGHLNYQCHQEFLEVEANAYKAEAVEAEEEEEEEQVVLELTPAAHPNPNLATESFKKEMLEKVDNSNGNMENMAEEEGDLLEPLLNEIKANRRERVTLADLFLASDDHFVVKAEPSSQVTSAPAGVVPEKKVNGAVDAVVTEESPSCRAKHGGSLTEKHAPWKKGGEESPLATKKIYRMIRMMLKKKIHPEMARDMHASVPGAQACRRDECSDESVSLL